MAGDLSFNPARYDAFKRPGGSMTMDPFDKIAELLFEAGQLARTSRSGYALLRSGEQNVAEHSHRAALVACVIARLDPTCDVARVLAMALWHDMPETRTSDLNYLNKRYLTVALDSVVNDQTAGVPFGEDLRGWIQEYEQGDSIEAKIVRDADQIELILTLREQHSAGAQGASAWIDDAVQRLQTNVGRQLAQAILRVDPDRWWKT